jgi:hypothetical protein
MYDQALGSWVAEQVQKAGVVIYKGLEVVSFGTAGKVAVEQKASRYQRHWVLGREAARLERHPSHCAASSSSCPIKDRRWREQLKCTSLSSSRSNAPTKKPATCCTRIIYYLRRGKRLEMSSGGFPDYGSLIRSAADPSKATREYAIERQGRFHGFVEKWTTARQLG